MNRQNNDGALPEREQVQARVASSSGAAVSSSDGSDAACVNHGKPASMGVPKKSRFRTARGWVAFACVAFALAGMAFRVGIGTPSAFGIQQISAICPLGALETMAGAKGVMLHPLLLFVLVVALIALAGKAFCAWMCPVPWLQKFFLPKKRGVAAKGDAGHEASTRSGAGLDVRAKGEAGCEALGLSGAAHDAPASCDDSDAGSAQAKPSTAGVAEAREPQIGTASGASCQKTRECVSVAGGEYANDAHGVTTATSECAAKEPVGGCGSGSLDSARTRAVFGSNNTEPARKQAACAPSACAACAGASACAKALAPVGGKRDGVRLDSRHAVLVGTLASAAVFGFPVFCLICPVGLTFATIIGLWNLVQFNEPSWALIIFPIILIAEVTVLRKWCSKICPISALVSLLSNLNITLRPRVKADACLRSCGVDCHACVDVCPEQLDPHSKHIPECSKCGKCVEACPAKAISIKLLK